MSRDQWMKYDALFVGSTTKQRGRIWRGKKTNSYPDQWWPMVTKPPPPCQPSDSRALCTHSLALKPVVLHFHRVFPHQLWSAEEPWAVHKWGCVVNFLFKISSVSVSQSQKLLNSWDGKQILDHDTTSISWEPEDSITLPNPLFPLLAAWKRESDMNFVFFATNFDTMHSNECLCIN